MRRNTFSRLPAGLAVAAVAALLALTNTQTAASAPANQAPPNTPTATNTPSPTPPLCFTGDTLISTPTGPVPIDQLAAGDTVLSYDLATGSFVPGRVASVFSREVRGYLSVHLGDGTTIRVTGEHPFYDAASGSYRAIKTFHPGESVSHVTPDGLAPLQIVSIERIDEAVRVYNLHVDDDDHNYVAAGVLVHNKTPTITPTFTPTATNTPTPTLTPTATPTPTPTFFCFTGDTLISTAMGPVPIDKLAAGDSVLSYDLASRSFVPGRVASVFSREVRGYLSVHLGDGTTIRVTGEHPFYDAASGSYRAIKTFHPGESVSRVTPHGLAPLQILSIERIDESVRVYNLHVDEDDHNYFAAGVLVHNKTPTITPTFTPTATNTPTPTFTPTATTTPTTTPIPRVVGGTGSFAAPNDPGPAADAGGGDGGSRARAVIGTVAALVLGGSAWYVRRRMMR